MATNTTNMMISHEVGKLDNTFKKATLAALWDSLTIKPREKTTDPVGRHLWSIVFKMFLEEIREACLECPPGDMETASLAKLLIAETILMCMRNRWALQLEDPNDKGRELQPGSNLCQATEKEIVMQHVKEAREWNKKERYSRLEAIIWESTDYLKGVSRLPVFEQGNMLYDETRHETLKDEESILRAYLRMLFSDQRDLFGSNYKSWEEFINIFIYASKDREAIRQYRVKGCAELLDHSHLQLLEDLRGTLEGLAYDGPLTNKAMVGFFNGTPTEFRDLSHPDMRGACGTKG